MALSLQSTLTSKKENLAANIMKSLENQGSILTKSSLYVIIQPYDGLNSPQIVSQTDILVPILVSVIIVVAVLFVVISFKLKRPRSSVSPLDSEQNEEFLSKNSHLPVKNKNLSTESKHPSVVVAKVQAEYANDTANVNDSIESFKADQEARLQERIAQREAIKAKVARQKADELKVLRTYN